MINFLGFNFMILKIPYTVTNSGLSVDTLLAKLAEYRPITYKELVDQIYKVIIPAYTISGMG